MLIFKLIFIFLLNCELCAVDIGSDTAVTRFNTQQTLQNGDRIAGFAALNAGFELFDSNVAGIFDSTFPVSGDIQLNGGVLNLFQDLELQEQGNFVSVGTIHANQHSVNLAPSMTSIPSGDIVDCNVTFVTQDSFPGQNVLGLDWSFDDKYIACGLQPSGANEELFVLEFDGSSLTQKAFFETDAERVLSCSWHPSLLLLGVARNSGPGPELLIFSFDPNDSNPATALTLTDSAELGGEARAVNFHPTGDYIAVSSTNNANEIIVYPINSSGVLDAPNSVTFNFTPSQNPDQDSMRWDSTGIYLAIGSDAATGDDLFVLQFGTSPSLSLTQNASFNSGRIRGVSWNSIIPNYLATAGDTSPQLRVWEHDATGGTLTQIASNVAGVNCWSVDWNRNGECLALGTNANGAAEELFTYFFDSVALSFSQISAFETGNNTRNVRWSRDGKFLAEASNSDDLNVYKVNAANVTHIFSNIRFYLNSNVTLQDCAISFTGENIVNGRGNCLTFTPTCTFIVGANSGVFFEDVRIEGFQNSKILMEDTTSTVTFNNVTIIQDEDYDFNTGHFEVVGSLKLEGNGKTFNYLSDRISVIKKTGALAIGPGLTFRYDPSVSNQNLITFENGDSQLILDSAILATSDVGIQLTGGRLVVKGQSFLFNEGSSASEGIIFGDGVVSANNLCIEWEPAANLDVVTGFFSNANI